MRVSYKFHNFVYEAPRPTIYNDNIYYFLHTAKFTDDKFNSAMIINCIFHSHQNKKWLRTNAFSTFDNFEKMVKFALLDRTYQGQFELAKKFLELKEQVK